MPPITRSKFQESRLFRCALTFKKRDEERLKNLRDLLERVDEKKKYKGTRPANKNPSAITWKIPDGDVDRGSKGRNTQEDEAILSANIKKTTWIFGESNREYTLTLGGHLVMKIPADIHQRLKPFQRDAVKWIASVGPVGGILADDMGMGKTFMSLAALGARMRVKRASMTLVVAPVSILGGWTEEAKMFLPKFVKSVRIVKLHGGDQKSRQKTIRNAWRDASPDKPYLIISSWGLVCAARTMKTFLPPSGRHWDYVVLDEAHVIKNHKSTRSKCCRRICHKSGTSRLLLTGTPFQNDVTELWSIVNMASGNKVLGKLPQFNREYGKPIRDARCRNASSYAMKQGKKADDALKQTLKPYLLRRLKMDFLKDELPTKHDICVWVKPSKQQTQMYREMVKSNFGLAEGILSQDTKVAQSARARAFKILRKLQSICGHPLIRSKGDSSIGSALKQTHLKDIIHGSRKLELSVHMLKGFKAEDLKTLLFSQSTQILDVIQYVLLQQGGFKIARLDGSVCEKRRQDMVELFQKGMFDVLLVTTTAGGVGLTLTRASRVIVYDPSWNPSQDAQAVDRAYRIGQTQEVRVYRLFSANTIEEKMYEKQVHKDGFEKTIFTEGSMPEERYFDKKELYKVFEIIPDGSCKLLKRFQNEDVAKVTDAHRHDLVGKHSSVVGISDHQAVYTQKRKPAFSDATASGLREGKRSKGSPSSSSTATTTEDAAAAAEETKPPAAVCVTPPKAPPPPPDDPSSSRPTPGVPVAAGLMPSDASEEEDSSPMEL